MLNNNFNRAFGMVFIPFIKLSASNVFILGFFACVRLNKYMDYISYTFVLVLTLSCFILIFPISIIMSSLYNISKDFSRNLSTQIRKTVKDTKRYLESQLKSCSYIHCRVGSLYHMEAQAKLTLLHYIINGGVFLLVNVKT